MSWVQGLPFKTPDSVESDAGSKLEISVTMPTSAGFQTTASITAHWKLCESEDGHFAALTHAVTFYIRSELHDGLREPCTTRVSLVGFGPRTSLPRTGPERLQEGSVQEGTSKEDMHRIVHAPDFVVSFIGGSSSSHAGSRQTLRARPLFARLPYSWTQGCSYWDALDANRLSWPSC